MVWDARLTVTDATRTRLGPSVGAPRAPVMLVRSPQAARSASAARVNGRVRRGCMLPPTGRASGGTLAGARRGTRQSPGFFAVLAAVPLGAAHAPRLAKFLWSALDRYRSRGCACFDR